MTAAFEPRPDLPRAPRIHHVPLSSERVNRSTVLAIVLGGLAGVAIVALVLIIIGRPKTQPCDPRTCPSPPRLQAIALGTPCPSILGVGCEYDADVWTPTSNGSAGQFELKATDMVMDIRVTTSGQSPQDAVTTAVDLAKQTVPNLAPDCVKIQGIEAGCPEPVHELLGPEVGYVQGVGGMWSATAQDTGRPVSILIMASSKGGVTTSVTVVAYFPWANVWDHDASWGRVMSADTVSNSVTWPGAS